ncbi:MAG: tRNA (adenosine(37)-N6)-threonylcarbamoyltransferase complex dimerization subunit type 1 TsaB [Chloroflexota bacterium]|nr:tRNA (adenosine(37)-N6)-threonylcarbamoyltransferase complex dimerization subunit type 1 TsaB [Chloroflexota bacterium]
MPPMILAIDTATHTVGLAVYDGIRVHSESVWTSRNFHTVELAPAIVDLLAKTDKTINEIGAVGVSLGPGSFTGLRIGMAVAKGICLANRLPIIGIPTLDALAASQIIRDLPMAAVLQAGRGRLAVGWFRAEEDTWISTREIELMTPQELSAQIKSPTLISGELSETDQRTLARKYRNVQLASPAQALRRPAYLAELAWKRWQDGDIDDPATLSPIYLHHREPIPG